MVTFLDGSSNGRAMTEDNHSPSMTVTFSNTTRRTLSVGEMIPTSIRSLIGRRKAWSMERRTRRSSGYDRPNARQRENRDVVYIGGSAPRQRVRQSMRDRNGRPTTSCPERVRFTLGSGEGLPVTNLEHAAKRNARSVRAGFACLFIFL